mmetsp:Transcript_15133/g.46939  ORF Transcript_15133/g.46939 Transcript_15133/m.46939 type:complete len:362 (+) Transcript_15133:32-1117(+)
MVVGSSMRCRAWPRRSSGALALCACVLAGLCRSLRSPSAAFCAAHRRWATGEGTGAGEASGLRPQRPPRERSPPRPCLAGRAPGLLREACPRAPRAQGGDPSGSGLAAETQSIRAELESLLAEIRSGADAGGAAHGGSWASPASERDAGPDFAPAEALPATPGFAATPEPAASPPVRGEGAPTAAAAPTAAPGPAPSPGAPRTGATKVVVVSAGHDSGDIADFFLEDRLVPVSGNDDRRGLNVVVIDPGAGRLVSGRSYDLWGDPEAQNRALAADLRALPDGHVVLAALKDSGMENLRDEAIDALAGVGASIEDRLGFRESYALIGVKGGRALAERSSSKMLLIDAVLPFEVGPRTAGAPA